MRLKKAKVVVAGVGGLGCPASLYLSAAGIGRILLIDNDRFELSNLNRQILGSPRDLRKLKTEVAYEKLKELNPDVEVLAEPVTITESNIRGLIQHSDVVVDAMDNWETRFIINKACVYASIPLVHAGVYSWYGQITTIFPGKGPCLRCLIPVNPAEIKPFPVLGAIPGFFAMLQVLEVLKLLTGIGEPLIGKLLMFDGADGSLSVVEIQRNTSCPVCSDV